MNTSTEHPIASRRQALALAGALAATVVTAVVAIGGLSHRTAAHPPAPAPVLVQPAAPAAPAPAAATTHWADD